MIRRSAGIATAAILLSLGLHLLGLGVTVSDRPPAPAPADAPPTDMVALGNAFEDVAEPVSSPVEAEPAPVPEPPVETPPEPDRAEIPTSEALVASDNPQQVAAPDIARASTVQPDRLAPTPGDAGDPATATVTPPVTAEVRETAPAGSAEAPADPVAQAADPVAQSADPAPQPDAAPAPAVTAALTAPPVPAAPVPVAPAPAAIPVIPLAPQAEDGADRAPPVVPVPDPPEAEAGSALAVAASPRPRDRPRPPAARGSPDDPMDFSSLRVPPAQLIESPLTVYRRDGIDQIGGQRRSGGAGYSGSGGPGNSDVTNYAGRVLVHLNRAPPVPVSGRGFARVMFEINRDGSLAWVDIIDGTGTPEIDRAAKDQVRSAAPFPPPPGGASRKLVFLYRIE